MKKVHYLLILLLVMMTSMVMVGCKPEEPEPEPEQPVVTDELSLKLSQTELSLVIGYTYQMEAKVTTNNGAEYTLTWESDNEKIATVSDKGLITAIKNGEATITCTVVSAGEKLKRRCTVTVSPDKVILSDDTIYMTPNSKDKISATILSGKSLPITYKTANSSIVTVDKDGNITSLNKKGNTYIVASATGAEPDTCLVYVGDFLTIEPRNVTLKVGKTQTFTVSNSEAQWTVEDPTIVRLDGSTITALAVGSTNIIVKYGNMTASAKVEVFSEPENVTINLPKKVYVVPDAAGNVSLRIPKDVITIYPSNARTKLSVKLEKSDRTINLKEESEDWVLQAKLGTGDYNENDWKLKWFYIDDDGVEKAWSIDVQFFDMASFYKVFGNKMYESYYTGLVTPTGNTKYMPYPDPSASAYHMTNNESAPMYYTREDNFGANGHAALITDYNASDASFKYTLKAPAAPGIANMKKTTHTITIFANAFNGRTVEKVELAKYGCVLHTSFEKYVGSLWRADDYLVDPKANEYRFSAKYEKTDINFTSMDIGLNYDYVAEHDREYSTRFFYTHIYAYYYDKEDGSVTRYEDYYGWVCRVDMGYSFFEHFVREGTVKIGSRTINVKFPIAEYYDAP